MSHKLCEEKHIVWWYGILAIDMVFITITVFINSDLTVPHMWRLKPFNLANEMNFAVWWSSILLMTLGLLCYELYSATSTNRLAWFILAILLVGLSLDELGSFHERIKGDLVVLLVMAAILAYALLALFFRNSPRCVVLLIGSGFMMFGFVAFQEYLEHKLDWPPFLVPWRIGVEEGSELLGMLLILFGVVYQRVQTFKGSVRVVIPRISLMQSMQVILLLGLFLHLAISLLVVPALTDIGDRGNPAAWYPMVVYFLLFSTSYWKYLEDEKGNGSKAGWGLLMVFFIMCSIGSVHSLLPVLPFIGKLVPLSIISDFSFLYYGKFFVLGLFCIWAELLSKRNLVILIFLVLMPLVILIDQEITTRWAILGIFSYFTAKIVLQGNADGAKQCYQNQ